jgi:hypothetical protein
LRPLFLLCYPAVIGNHAAKEARVGSDETKELTERKRYLVEWVGNLKQAQEALPFVKKILEKTEWEIAALSNRPPGAIRIPTGDLSASINRTNRYMAAALPMVPVYDTDRFGTLVTLASSETSRTYSYVAQVGDGSVAGGQEYSVTFIRQYQDLQEKHEQPAAVCSLLEKFKNPSLLGRFARATMAYNQAVSGVGEPTAAANEMRNLLDGVKGELFDKARRKEKKKMTWNIMAERLAKRGPGGIEHQELLEQGEIFSSLFDRLSKILKAREAGTRTDVDIVWIEVLDHIYAVLGLVNL